MANDIMLASALGEVGAIINETDRPTVDILEEAGRQHPLLSSEFAALVTWTTDTRGIGSGRNGGVLDRDRFISPNNPYEQMEVAYDAADDDAVSGWLDASEALAFRRMGITCDDEDEEDIWAQIMDGIEIEDRMREIWREMNIVSQCTVAAWYGKRSFTVRGKTGAGTKRKKTYNDLTVPIGLTVLDPLKIVPCLPGDTLIHTDRGPVPIKDVLKGDRVWSYTDEGPQLRSVTDQAKTGHKEIWKVQTRNGSLRCTDNHRVLILKRGGSKNRPSGPAEVEWVAASDLNVGDYMVRVLGLPEGETDGPTPGIAKIVGALVGDGVRSTRHDHGGLKTAEQFFWSHVDRSSGEDGCWPWKGTLMVDGRPKWAWKGKYLYPARVAWQAIHGTVPGIPVGGKRAVQLRKRLSCSVLCVNPAHHTPNGDAVGIMDLDLSSTRVAARYAEFRLCAHVKEQTSWRQLVESELGVVVSSYDRETTVMQNILRFASQELVPWASEVMSYKSPDRFVPSWVWTSSKKAKEAFLEGYLEADGCEEMQYGFKVKCTSERLVQELKILCDDLGISTSNIFNYRPTGILPNGRTHTCGVWGFTGYPEGALRPVPTTYDHLLRQHLPTGFVARRINAVEPTGETLDVFDLAVEDSHNFIAEGQVVHNCGSFLFQQEQLAYYADPTERDVIDSWLVGDDDSGADAIIQRLIVAKYEPDYRDRKQLGNFGVDPNRLYLLNPKYVWQHTATKPGYSRFAPIRMKTIFKLLDLKHQLQAMDRAHLIGATNFILLIKKGTDNLPAHQAEITSLQAQAKTISKVPVIVGDHRLSLEIITPKTDHTLLPTRYDLIDTRIASRLWGMFVTGAERDDSVKLVKVVAQGLESRRNSQRRKLMKHLIMPTFKINNQLQERPELMFSPRRIALDFDPTMSTYLLDLRDRGDLSRSSILSEVDYDEADEAAKRKMEKEKYDDIFEPPSSQVPVPAPGQIVEPGPVVAPVVPGAPNDPKRAGRSLGGNHGRGGNGSAGRGAGVPPAPGKTPNPKTGTSKPNPDGE